MRRTTARVSWKDALRVLGIEDAQLQQLVADGRLVRETRGRRPSFAAEALSAFQAQFLTPLVVAANNTSNTFDYAPQDGSECIWSHVRVDQRRGAFRSVPILAWIPLDEVPRLRS